MRAACPIVQVPVLRFWRSVPRAPLLYPASRVLRAECRLAHGLCLQRSRRKV
jgi:hypothetical protein